MPTIRFGEQQIECERGENLRAVLIAANAPLYNGLAGAIHCRGLGTCGTCSVEVQGAVSSMTTIEQWRLRFPPHRSENPLRLACQCRVLGDLKIRKHAGLWGNKLSVSDSES